MTSETPSEQFWESHYQGLTNEPSGRPSAILVQYATGLEPGRSLDLGCSRGDDAIWLARQGWDALGVDISATAIETAARRAAVADLSGRARFEQHDLPASLPEGTFDLVTAFYLQSPVPFDRRKTLRLAAERVATGGLLLIVAHGSRAPWSWADPATVYPTAEQNYLDLELTAAAWTQVFVGPVTRQATGPGGQVAEVLDTVVAIQRR